jgi:hypothetical protein
MTEVPPTVEAIVAAARKLSPGDRERVVSGVQDSLAAEAVPVPMVDPFGNITFDSQGRIVAFNPPKAREIGPEEMKRLVAIVDEYEKEPKKSQKYFDLDEVMKDIKPPYFR